MCNKKYENVKLNTQIPSKISLLLEQRKGLVQSIYEDKKSFHNACLAIIAFFSGFLAFVTDPSKIKEPNILMGISQIVFFIIIFFYFLLTNMNHYRDCIRAIDEQLRDEYGIDVYFIQGEASYKIINQLNSPFARGMVLITLLISLVIGTFAYLFVFPQIFSIWGVWSKILVIVESIVLFFFLIQNTIYRWSGKSKHYKVVKSILTESKMTDFSFSNEIDVSGKGKIPYKYKPDKSRE